MPTITIPQIVERLQQLSGERLLVVYDFVSYLADREGQQASIEGTSESWQTMVLIDDAASPGSGDPVWGSMWCGVLGVLVEAKHKGMVPRLKPVLDDLITRACCCDQFQTV